MTHVWDGATNRGRPRNGATHYPPNMRSLMEIAAEARYRYPSDLSNEQVIVSELYRAIKTMPKAPTVQ